jgi:hypothetical protein
VVDSTGTWHRPRVFAFALGPSADGVRTGRVFIRHMPVYYLHWREGGGGMGIRDLEPRFGQVIA